MDHPSRDAFCIKFVNCERTGRVVCYYKPISSIVNGNMARIISLSRQAAFNVVLSVKRSESPIFGFLNNIDQVSIWEDI